jgi:hypothetical protein
MMNERIKELAKLATKEIWGTNLYNGAPSFDGYELDQEKFAELIVKECAKLCYDQVEFFKDNKDRAFQCLADGDHIKGYFGVEE